MSAKTEEKRMEFAERVKDSLADGVVMWQNLSVPLAAPENAESGRPYKGLNALYLLQNASDNGFMESRWLTVKDANKQGDKVKTGEKGTSLEYWGTRGDTIGTHSYSVFNVAQLDSFQRPEMPPSPPPPDYDKAAAILKKTGVEIPQNRDEDSYRAVLEKTLVDVGKETPLFNEVHTKELKDLRVSLASTFLMWETHIPLMQDISKDTAKSWSESIQHNPIELFKAIRDAGKLVNEMVKGLELEHEQPKAAEQETAPQDAPTDEKKSKAIIPKVGDRVTFRAKHAQNGSVSLTGEVVAMDDQKGTVTMQCGAKTVPVFRGKGSFFEAPPLEQEETKEHAKSLAQKHVGENGKVFFARDDGVYKGVIVETTPTFAIQEVNRGMAVLHRQKDLFPQGQGDDMVQKGRNVVIHKEAGRATVSPNTTQQWEKEGNER